MQGLAQCEVQAAYAYLAGAGDSLHLLSRCKLLSLFEFIDICISTTLRLQILTCLYSRSYNKQSRDVSTCFHSVHSRLP